MAIGALTWKKPAAATPFVPVEPIDGAVRIDAGVLAMPPRRRIDLGGVLLDQVDMAAAVDRVRAFLDSRQPHQIVTVNVDFLSIAERDSDFRSLINQADLAVADGMPLVWASRLQQHPLPERVAGVDLVEASCEVAATEGHGVFLLGAAPGVAEAAAQTLQDRHPGLRIAGVYSPPFGAMDPEEDRHIVELIRRAAPGLLFVALGAPRQDHWIRAHLHELNVPVAMGVGCVFDLLAGSVSRAPAWMQRVGLEWAFRLGQEPGRLWRRYIVNDVPTVARLMAASLRAGGDEPIEHLIIAEPHAPEYR